MSTTMLVTSAAGFIGSHIEATGAQLAVVSPVVATTTADKWLTTIRIYGSPDIRCWSHACLLPNAEEDSNTWVGNVRLLDEFGQVGIELLGTRFRYLECDKKRVTVQLSHWGMATPAGASAD